ncbi:hypothetical protein Ndes2437B_g06897 [Nannochloris sp. 'desiccata']
MPPKRKRGHSLEYHSSEDEDYLPPGSPFQPSSSKSKPTVIRQQYQDEDISLAQRRHSLQQQQQTKPQKKHASLTALDETTGLPCRSPLNIKFEVPEEVLHTILYYWCSDKGAIPGAAIALCINKAWRSAVLSHPELWYYVDLSFGWCRPTNTILQTYSLKWIAMEVLSLEGCSTITEVALLSIAENCPKLRSLNLSYCTGFREQGLADALCSMLSRPLDENSFPLQDLDLSFIQISPKGSGLDTVLRRVLLEQANNPTEGPVLETLLIAGCPMLSHRPLKAVCDASIVAAPNLQSLHLCHVARALGWLPSVSTSGLPEGVSAGNAMWNKLKTLRITGNPSLSQISSDIEYLAQMLRNSPSLEEIALIGFRQVYLDDLMEFFSEYTAMGEPRQGLKRLTLDDTFASRYRLQGVVGEPSFYHVFANSTWMRESLERLSVIGSKDSFNDAACEELANYYPYVVEIDARETGISEKGVRALVKSAQRRGLLSSSGDGKNNAPNFDLNIDSCRNVDRKIRQAASKSIHDLVTALGL